jgi:hypothetical protein
MFSMSRLGAATAVLALSFAATAAQADTIVKWKSMAGYIVDPNITFSDQGGKGLQFVDSMHNVVGLYTTPETNNVDSIKSGTFPWTVNSGEAQVNLTLGRDYGHVTFDVQGLNINGTKFTGTAGPVTSVVGTLKCDSGFVDTQLVSLSLAGVATFDGSFTDVPSPCQNPRFLIRTSAGATGRWIATGTDRVTFTK